VAPEIRPVTAAPAALAVAAEAEAPPARDASTGRDQDARRTPVETLRSNNVSLQGVTVMPPRDSQPAEPRKSRVNQSFTDFEAAAQAPSPEQQEAARSEAPGSAPGVPPEEPASAPGAAEEPSLATEPISFWELPQGIRDDLPEMRITVLVYAESPEDRFLLMGGQRMVEKDEYQEGIVLEEIRRDGAVFLYRKYRFLVKG
jgi:general secretion pathway protein B